MMAETQPQRGFSLTALLRDIRVLQVIGQIIFAILLVAALSILWINIVNTLNAKNLTPTFTFLQSRAGFQIAETPAWYSANSTYGEAFLVGVINTLRIVILGLIGATALGILVGIFLLSHNWLIRSISRVYVEVLRNTPLLVQLIFWYYVIMLSFPRDDITIPNEGVTYVSLRIVIYLLVLIAAWLYTRTSRSATRMNVPTGVLGAIVILEIAVRLPGSSGMLVSLILGGIGLLMYVILAAVPQRFRGYVMGAAMLLMVNFALGILFSLANLLNLLPYPDVIRWETLPAIFISIKGFVFPEIRLTANFVAWGAFVVFGLIVAGGIWVYSGRITMTTGRPIPRGLYAVIAVVGLSLLGWFFLSLKPPVQTASVVRDGQVVTIDIQSEQEAGTLTLDEQVQVSQDPFIVALPLKPKFRFTQGTQVTPEYMALLLGLIIYTSAFIAEIVRAGIQAVPYGQTEAARALGLSTSQVLGIIILPQALRVIIPPLTNQYLNLTKNSSLATAVAYADIYAVGVTIMNQSGQSVTGFTLIMLIYLSFSLITSAVMNLVNARFQLVTR